VSDGPTPTLRGSRPASRTSYECSWTAPTRTLGTRTRGLSPTEVVAFGS
jgi:hypothetical protein